MEEITIFKSDDGRSFETRAKCEEWEAYINKVRFCRSKIWHYYLQQSNTNALRGVSVSDETSLPSTLGGLETIFGPKLENVDRNRFENYITGLTLGAKILFDVELIFPDAP